MSELIQGEQISTSPPDVEVFFNRPVIPPRDLTENNDWFISYDTYTDQILVLDLATGWSDIQRQTYSLHDDSPDYGVQNLNNLRDGILLKGNKKLKYFKSSNDFEHIFLCPTFYFSHIFTRPYENNRNI